MGTVAGERHDGDGRTVQAIRHIQGVPLSDKPGLLSLDAVSAAGVIKQYYLWVDFNGKLRVGTGIPTNQDGDGTIVGTQTA